MDPNQYYYTSQAEQFPPYQAYPPPQYPGASPQLTTGSYIDVNRRVSYIQPHYGAPLIAEPPPPAFVAELPAALPPAPPTTTSSQQLNEDELLAHKLQNLEVEEARRRSSSVVSHRPSNYSLRDATALAPRKPVPRNAALEAAPPLPVRPHSESFSNTMFYGPDSFGPPPAASFEATTDGRTLMAYHGANGQPPLPSQMSNLPEVVSTPPQYPPAGLELVQTTSSVASFPSPTPSMTMDPASLASYLEKHREVPYPPQWNLPPVLDTLYGSNTRAPKASDWLDIPLSREWRRVRASQNAVTPTQPAYSFAFKYRSGGLLDARHTWTMQPNNWTYNLKFDDATGLRKSEFLTPPKGLDLITTYIPAQNYDSLRFIGPDGSVFLWVAHAPLSSVVGTRYDTLRHALFMAPKGCDPLYGEIVADHAYWDGFIDYSEVHRVTCSGCGASPINGLCWRCNSCKAHEICEQCRLANRSVKSTCSFTLVNLPDEALYIRSSAVDPALICATLQIMRDWECQTLRIQKNKDPRRFRMTEDKAREGDLGKMTHWRQGDKAPPRPTKKIPIPEVVVEKPIECKKTEKARAKELEKMEKARKKEKEKEAKNKKRDRGTSIIGVAELIRGSAQVGGSVGDVGEALRRHSGDSTAT